MNTPSQDETKSIFDREKWRIEGNDVNQRLTDVDHRLTLLKTAIKPYFAFRGSGEIRDTSNHIAQLLWKIGTDFKHPVSTRAAALDEVLAIFDAQGLFSLRTEYDDSFRKFQAEEGPSPNVVMEEKIKTSLNRTCAAILERLDVHEPRLSPRASASL